MQDIQRGFCWPCVCCNWPRICPGMPPESISLKRAGMCQALPDATFRPRSLHSMRHLPGSTTSMHEQHSCHRLPARSSGVGPGLALAPSTSRTACPYDLGRALQWHRKGLATNLFNFTELAVGRPCSSARASSSGVFGLSEAARTAALEHPILCHAHGYNITN